MTMKQGVIEFFNPDGKPAGNRGGRMYSFKMDDGEWYSCGFESPGDLSAGDKVKFDNVQNAKGYWNVDLSTLKVKKNASATKATPAAKAAGGKENWDARAKYWEDKEVRDIENQKRIGYAGAVNSALTMFANLVSAGGTPISASALKKTEGLDAVKEIVFTMADEIYGRICTRPFELDEVEEPEVNGKEELEATEKEEETLNDDDWGDD